MGDEHDAVACGDAEERNEPDHRRNTQHSTGEVDADDAADQCEGQVHHDQQGVAWLPESKDEQHEHADDDTCSQYQQSSRRGLLAFELSSVFDAISRRHWHRLRDGRAHVFDDAAQVPAGHIARNDDSALDVLSQNHVRPDLTSHIREDADRHRSPVGRVDR